MTDFDESFWPVPVGEPSIAEKFYDPDGAQLQQAVNRAAERQQQAKETLGFPVDVPGVERDESKTIDGFDVASCRSCWAPIVWANTLNGERMPVDAVIVADGNVVLSFGPRGSVTATVLDQASLIDDGPRRKAHFATCPDAVGWRRR